MFLYDHLEILSGAPEFTPGFTVVSVVLASTRVHPRVYGGVRGAREHPEFTPGFTVVSVVLASTRVHPRVYCGVRGDREHPS